MKSEWTKVSLLSVCSRLSSGKSISSKLLKEKGVIPVYGGNGVRGYIEEGENFNGECAIIGRQGAYCGNVRFFSGKAYMTEHAIVAQANACADTRFLAYKLSLMQLGRLSGQSAQPGLSVKVLGEQVIDIPPLPIQRKIASILSALDDKIETNNAICRNLEEQAMAIYKSWFVDFEPFGRMKPCNWKEKDIYSVCEIIYGAPFSSKLFNQEKKGLPLIRIRDLNKQESDVYTDEVHPKAYIIHAGDIVVGMDGEFSPYIWGGDAGLLNQRVCVFKNKRKKGSFFLYFSIKPQLEYIEQTEMATTVIHIGKKDFDAFSIFLPTEKILDSFDDITFPFYEEIIQRRKENRRLTSIRESLLPRLMSGELTVKEIN